jgi:hypothetical protein
MTDIQRQCSACGSAFTAHRKKAYRCRPCDARRVREWGAKKAAGLTGSARVNDLSSLKSRTLVTADGCWEWQGKVIYSGYGEAHYQNRQMQAHRAMWLASGRPIPNGLQLDHLCRNRRCCNPDHLEPVTCAENIRRGWAARGRNPLADRCGRGHRYDDGNTYYHRGQRYCRACNRLHAANSRARQQRRGLPHPDVGTPQ